jgi:hypothetical protein
MLCFVTYIYLNVRNKPLILYKTCVIDILCKYFLTILDRKIYGI